MGHVVQVLRGADTERVRSLGHDRLSTWGLLHDLQEKALVRYVRLNYDNKFMPESIFRP